MPEAFGWTVHYACLADLAEAGFAHFERQPFIRDQSFAYAAHPNAFLIDRSLGVWDPSSRGKGRLPTPPSCTTIGSLASWLCNALEWAEVRNVDLMRCDYSAVLLARYQREMLQGIWSASGKRLLPATVNARVSAVLEYQMWASDKGLRDPFCVPTVTTTYRAPSHQNSRSHELKVVQARQGKVRVDLRSLSFPSSVEVDAWRKRIYSHPARGETEGLLVDLILDTAIRREEAACWRVDTLPLARSEWRITNPDEPLEHQTVLVQVCYGAKGKEYGFDHGDKIGPVGEIHVPMLLANRIDEYRNHQRLKALRIAVRKGKSVAAQREIRDNVVHLFLHPETGQRYSGKQIYSLWRAGGGPPHWSPHAGRHWWACTYLERRMKQHVDVMEKVLTSPGISAESPLVLSLKDTAMVVIQLEISPQLRHRQKSTTELYLRWLFNRLRLPYKSREDGRDPQKGEFE